MQGEEGRTHVQTIKGLASYTTFVLGWTENVCCQPTKRVRTRRRKTTSPAREAPTYSTEQLM